MRFRQQQAHARAQTFRLLAWFAALLLTLVLSINGLLALVYKLLMPLAPGFPALFFETNTAIVLLLVLGGGLVELQRLRRGGGPRIARWLSGHVVDTAGSGLENRLLNVVDEMALASGQGVPRVYLLPREDAINAFVAGWGPHDTVLCVTQGALERLTRAELQGLVAHEFGHIKAGDLPLSMRLLALVWGLSLVHGYGRQLMTPDDEDHVHPFAWLIGLVFSAIGYLGWLAGRALQAAISRHREFLADASAIQFTRSRDGLGQVLRKIWHDQQARAGCMRHPAARMIATLLMHQPEYTPCLASHPRLSERIRRIFGRVLPPLPAPPSVHDPSEPRRPSHPAVAQAVPGRIAPAPLALSDTGVPLHALRGDRDAIGRLQRLSGPAEQGLAVLALMIHPANPQEHQLWVRLAQDLTLSQQIQSDVAALEANHRVPEFERLAAAVAAAPLDRRRALVEAARDLLRADGRVSPMERLWWLALRQRLSEPASQQGLMRPVTGQGPPLSQVEAAAHQAVSALSSYLARLVPVAETGPELTASSRAWLAAVYRRCGIPETVAQTALPPDANGLVLALQEVQALSWMVRPTLMKAWVEEAVNHSPQGLLSNGAADALRLVAGLIDAPLPPMLDAHYARR